MFTVRYENRDGRLVDMGIGDEAIPEFATLDEAIEHVRYEHMQRNPAHHALLIRHSVVRENMGAMDPANANYRWTIREET